MPSDLSSFARPGVDLRGYLIWTLLDNFEWAEGYHPRFGLLETDYSTQERRPRPSNEIIRLALGGAPRAEEAAGESTPTRARAAPGVATRRLRSSPRRSR